MRWLRRRRRHTHRIVTGYQILWHPRLGYYDQVIYRGCICSSPFLKHPTPKENTMSNLTHCDGPGCDETEDKVSQRLCDAPWIRVDQGQGAPKLDFHDRQCLTNWTTGKPRAATDSEPCPCDGAQVDPHTRAEHNATTVVTGL